MRDDDNDHEHAANLPTIVSIHPATGKAGEAAFTLTINGTNLTGATEVNFVDPNTVPGNGKGHGIGKHGKPDQKIAVTNIAVNQTGTQVTATVAIAADATIGDRTVRVETPNGDSTFTSSAGNTFSVQ
jgi:hypothetical protein